MESYERLMNMYDQKKRLLLRLKELNTIIKEQEKLVLIKRLQILSQSNCEDISKTITRIEKKLTKKK